MIPTTVIPTRVRGIMRKNFAKTILKIMRALFANYFCHFLPKTFLGFVLHIAEYRIDLIYVYGIDKIAYRHLQKLRTFCIAWPDRCTNISRVVTISKIPDVQQNVIHKWDRLCEARWIMRDLPNYAEGHQLCARIIG